MRIIGGEHKGRRIKTLNGESTRPTLDKVRGAIFNSLYDVSDTVVLDLFGGSGAMSLEALSRGAAFAVIVDHNQGAANIIGENVKALHYEDKTDVRFCDFHQALKKGDSFDVVFLDPPYGQGFVWESMAMLCKAKVLRKNAMVVAETGSDEFGDHGTLPFTLLKKKQYGRAKILYYRFDEE